MFANAIEFGGKIFLVNPPMEGLCLIASRGADKLIYFDPKGKVVGKKYLFPLELSCRNCARLVKDIRKNPCGIPTQVKLSFKTNSEQKSARKEANITLKVGPLKELTRQARKYYSSEIKSIKKKYDNKKVYRIFICHKNEETFPELRYLHASENKEDFKLSLFPRRYKFEYLRFIELKSWLYSNPDEEISPNRSGNYLIFSNPYAVLMLDDWFDGYPERKQIDSPLDKLFDLQPEPNIWEKAILSDFIDKLEGCNELLGYSEESELDDYDTNRFFEEYKTLFMEPS